MSNNFFINREDIFETAIILEEDKGFTQLDNVCDDEFEEDVVVYIDRSKKEFYFVHERHVEQIEALIASHHKQGIINIKIKEIESWRTN